MNFKNLPEDKLEVLPKFEKPIRDHWNGGYNKPFWQKINGFLRSRVGQKWDRVISEYVHSDWVPILYRNYHNLTHFVETDTFLKDGEIYIYTYGTYRYYTPRTKDVINAMALSEVYTDVFYVNPKDKVLSFQAKRRRCAKEKQEETFQVIGDYKQLVKLSGIWYYVSGGDFFRETHEPNEQLIDERGITSGKRKKIMHLFFPMKCIFKRQLNKRELKKYGLKNSRVIKKRCSKCGNDNCKNHEKGM